MSEVRVIQINESVFAENDRAAERIRRQMTDQGTFFLNVMSSPGSGKTTTLVALINRLKDRLKIGEMDVDIRSSLDAHARALMAYDTAGLDLLILENIGNLVCPAEFDTGAHKNITILSVPEGDDKPLKYPLMYRVSDVVIINKMDALAYFDFDLDRAKQSILQLNPNAIFFPISAKSGEGLDELCEWVLEEVKSLKAGLLK